MQGDGGKGKGEGQERGREGGGGWEGRDGKSLRDGFWEGGGRP